MIALRKALNHIFSNIGERVSFNEQSKKMPFPYIVYQFPTSSFFIGVQEVIPLQVDVWDNNQDTTELERLSTQIWRELEGLSFINEDVQFTIYRESRLPVVNEDGKKVRELTFHIRLMDRG